MVHDEKVFSVKKSKKLDSFWRKIFHNPKILFGKFLKKDDLVADFGCGTGFFSIPMSKMIRNGGKLFAIDLQSEMLDIVKKKIKNNNIDNIELLQCGKNDIGLKTNVNFFLAFFVVHEVPDQNKFFSDVYSKINDGGKLYFAEPNFRVTEEEFNESIKIAKSVGFKIFERKNIFKSRTIIFTK